MDLLDTSFLVILSVLTQSQGLSYFVLLVLTDIVPLDHDNWECGDLLRLLSDLQCCLRGLQSSHQPLLDHGETAFRTHLLLTLSYHPSHRTLAKVCAKHHFPQFSFGEFVGV